ncbi:MAG: phosphohistidine phosphatase SixA [Gemmataceae bacterium]|nr:phosphohistidine phosphatase SixA [Gemmataceae bacterium]MDW8263773.1 phosphohistidine phosphatase SixA [Gemmataceae bacterium]
MLIYLIRHAEAAPLGHGGTTHDAERPLTEDGLAQCRALALGLHKRQARFDLVLTSPLVRAVQTAEGMLKHWPAPAPELRHCDELTPGTKRRQLARYLRNCTTEQIALVGHQPDLGQFAAWLLGSNKVHIELAKGGVALISCDDEPAKGTGSLLWLVTPAWLAD